jgi:hypothetical protein
MIAFPKFEHLYIIFAPTALPYRAKIGISIAAAMRKEQIKSELRPMFGNVAVYAIGFPVLYARQIECKLHGWFARMQYRGIQHTNGGTEWFWSLNILTCVALSILRLYMGEKWFLLPWVALMVPFPIDYILLTLLIAAIQWALILGGLWGAAWALNLF